MNNVLRRLNISRHISRHLVGEHHNETHHRITGMGLMAVGVVIAKGLGHFESLLLHFIGDLIGYALHGIGLIPYIGYIEHNKNHQRDEVTQPINKILPNVKTTNMNTQQNTATNIADVFTRYRMAPTPNDQFSTVGREVMERKIDKFVQAGEPVDFVMLGFPMKSTNTRDKVLGTLPDYGEQLSMEHFASFAADVKAAYEPGATITLISDGYVFNDLMNAADSTVANYEEIVKDMSRVAPAVQWYDLRDFYNKRHTIAAMRTSLMEQFGISEQELERRILTDPDVNYLYRGMIRFMEEDFAVRNLPSRNQLNKVAKATARNMMLRNEAYSGLIRSEFADSIRLSMHPSVNNGNKYSYQLIPGRPGNIWASPWHSAILVDKAGEFSTVHRKDAVAAGHNLVYKDGQPYYFQTKP